MAKFTLARKESNFLKAIRKYNDLFIGVDVHKATYAVAAYSKQYGVISSFTMEALPERLSELLFKHQSGIMRVVYEAGPCGNTLVRTLRNLGFNADVIVTGSIPRTSTRAAKNDLIDSRKLAEYAAKEMVRYVRIPTVQQEGQREIIRERKRICKDKREIMQKIKMFLLRNGISEPQVGCDWSVAWLKDLREREISPVFRVILNSMLEDLEYLKKRLNSIEKGLQELMKAPEHRDNNARLSKIPGIGLLTICTFLLEVYSPERFGTPRELGKYCGLAPQECSSGEKIRTLGLASGNRHLRHIFIEAAWRWKMNDPSAAQRYEKYLRNTKNAKKAIAAVAHKLAIIMWRMCVDGTEYEIRPQVSPTAQRA